MATSLKLCSCHSHNGLIRSPEGLAQRLPVRGVEVDRMDESRYLDKVGSVSALAEAEDFHVFDDEMIDQQYRRFHNGS